MNNMRLTITLLFCLFALSLHAVGPKPVKLSESSQISVLTCDAGNEIYSMFGHTAIRVKDSVNHIDFVFNFGTFDFKTPHFYTKYIQGLLPYRLSAQSYQRFLYSYIDNNRSVYEQPLNMTLAERQKSVNKLIVNMEPENRTYLYNFLYDNCSTRIRDLIVNSKDSIVWLSENKELTFWNLLDEYLDKYPWASWGIHTLLGNPGNEQATTWQYMFLPEYLKAGLSDAENKDKTPLVKDINVLYQAINSTPKITWYYSPWFVFSLAFIVIFFTIKYIKQKTIFKSIVFIFFLASGLLGLLLFFLGFFTLHPMTFPNWNILWACPFNILVAISVFYKKTPRLIRYYLTIYIGLLVAASAILLMTYPAIPFSTFPIIMIMGHLAYRIIFENPQN